MSVPPDLMKLIAGGGGTGTSPGPNPMQAAAPGNTAPAGGPMSSPQPKEGLSQAAMVNVSMVFKLLEQSLQVFGSQSEQGKAILSALKTLTGQFGQDRAKSESLIPAELMQLIQSVPGAGGGPPASQAMAGLPATQPAIPQGA